MDQDWTPEILIHTKETIRGQHDNHETQVFKNENQGSNKNASRWLGGGTYAGWLFIQHVIAACKRLITLS